MSNNQVVIQSILVFLRSKSIFSTVILVCFLFYFCKSLDIFSLTDYTVSENKRKNTEDLSDHFSSITSSLKVGDIVQFTQMSNTARSHTLMVYSKENGDFQLAAHTFNTKSRSLFEEADNAPTKIFVLIRVKSGS